jgi:putative pyruvate formate lyase activating enzyme
MKEQSRRDFIRSCLYLGASGLGAAWATLLSAGCKGKIPSASPPQLRDRGEARPRAVERAAGIRPDFEAAYLALHRSGELKRRGEELWEILQSCRLCPRECGINRHQNEGFCHASAQLEVSSHHPHRGEERPLVGKGGSGTIFFTNCSLRCVFCINWQISHEGKGEPRSIEELADMMLDLQKWGCHNINLVTPTHYSPHILLAVDMAAGKGLKLPLVYNTCGWERLEILKKLDGIVDIYLPDFKYARGEMSARYSAGAQDYPDVTKASLLDMYGQVGTAKPADDGLMYRGLMIRHLVMPNNVGGTREVIQWIAENLPKDTYLNIMAQYTPTYRAFEFREISRPITRKEYEEAMRWAREAGLTNLSA